MKRKKRKIGIILLSIVVVLGVLRLLLPTIVLNYVNRKLNELKEYRGHVQDIDIALIRGAYVIKDIRITKITTEGRRDTIPFFAAPEIDLSVEWRSLFKGRIVGEIHVEDPVLNFVKGKHKGEDVKADTADFRGLVRDVMPLRVNHFTINRAQIHYIDLTREPPVDVALSELYITASNLSNVNDSAKLLPASLKARGKAYDGEFTLQTDFDALAGTPTFDLNAEFKNVDLVQLNDFLRAYGNFDVKRGTFGLYTEFAAKEGAFGGYVKPLISDLDIVQWNKEEGNVGQVLWETLIGSAAELLENQPRDQIASKIPISGKFDDPKTNLWSAIGTVLRNAFVQALKPSIDRTISIDRMEEKEKGFLKQIFKRNDKGDKKARR